MHLLIVGGTGFIGRPLVEALLARGYQVTLLARSFTKAKRLFNGRVSLIGSIESAALDVDGVINLAGEPIIDKRWTPRRKQRLKQSRIDLTQVIVRWMAANDKQRPAFLINGSAIGYYGNYPEPPYLDETAKPIPCFSSDLCVQWEQAARQAQTLGVRVCMVRTGIVLGANGGALKRMLLPFKLGLGGPIGSGRQWFSWIHLHDMVQLLLYLVENPTISGPVNAVAPSPVTNAVFSSALARALKRPAFLPMPTAIVKTLFGEAAELLLEGQPVFPKKLLDKDFRFKYPGLSQALEEIVNPV